MDDERTIIRPRPGRRGQSTGAAADSDKTVIKPRPGGRSQAAMAASASLPEDVDRTIIKAKKTAKRGPLQLVRAEPAGFNTLLDCAATLLGIVSSIRQVQEKIDIDALHQQTTQQVREFEHNAGKIAITADVIQQARYVLCSLIDESVLNTPWGENSRWSQRSMLNLFHNETYGGERVFNMIDDAFNAPRKDYEFLEFLYVCLAIGFQGKYRIDPQGSVKLEVLRHELYQLLQGARDRYQKELAPPPEPAMDIKNRLHSFLPIWLLAAVLSIAAFGLFTYLLVQLNQDSDQLRSRIASLIPPLQATAGTNPARVRPEVLTLRELLAPEIERGILQVNDFPERVNIVLSAEELFGSGSTAVDPAFEPVLDKISKALEAIPGRIVVAGHTDNQNIRTPLYPSNWHLSLARASAVVKYMSGVASLKGRLLPEGRGDGEPLVSNDTQEGRAKNRRVSIDLFYVDSI